MSSDASEQRVLRSTPDWSETANNSEHLWVPTSASGDFCYVGESDCTVSTEYLTLERERERERERIRDLQIDALLAVALFRA